jgi:hypothetical protein
MSNNFLGVNPSLRGAALPTGWLNLTTFSNDVSYGTKAWTFMSNALASDDSKAIVAAPVGVPAVSNYLKGLALSSPVPVGATILGVEVRIEKSQGGAGFTDDTIKLVKAGVVSGNNKSTAEVWPAADAYTVYGGSTELWGLTLTAAEVNAADFGFVLACGMSAAFNPGAVDHMQMKIYYTT